jgi:hypothetical protein
LRRDVARIEEEIERRVSGWPRVETRAHRFGGTEFRVRGHEIGHVHGGRQADLPFPKRVREELVVSSGRASLHHLLPRTGWVTYYIRDPDDADRVVELFRLNYDRITRRRAPTAEARLARHGGSPG